MGLFFIAQNIYGQTAATQYNEAVKFIRARQYDFAFLEFRSVTIDFPKTKYAEEATFAIGEYFYNKKAHYEAIRHFSEYIKKTPKSEGAIFAKAYLLKIMRTIENPTKKERKAIESMKNDFFSKPVFLIFSEYKEVFYKSPFEHEFKIRYYIDMIEVHRNGKLFIKIAP